MNMVNSLISKQTLASLNHNYLQSAVNSVSVAQQALANSSFSEDDDADMDADDDDLYENPNNGPNGLSKSASAGMLARIQNRKRHKGDLKCQVCGANANGYNFDAITCESCKAFFRRNANKGEEAFRCLNGGKCTINVSTRKKCKRCRIGKCFFVGMRKDWIMSEMEREEKRKKIEENRMRKAYKSQNIHRDMLPPSISEAILSTVS